MLHNVLASGLEAEYLGIDLNFVQISGDNQQVGKQGNTQATPKTGELRLNSKHLTQTCVRWIRACEHPLPSLLSHGYR